MFERRGRFQLYTLCGLERSRVCKAVQSIHQLDQRYLLLFPSCWLSCSFSVFSNIPLTESPPIGSFSVMYGRGIEAPEPGVVNSFTVTTVDAFMNPTDAIINIAQDSREGLHLGISLSVPSVCLLIISLKSYIRTVQHLEDFDWELLNYLRAPTGQVLAQIYCKQRPYFWKSALHYNRYEETKKRQRRKNIFLISLFRRKRM